MTSQPYIASTYGERIAHVYDSLYPTVSDELIDRLQELAGEGPALELGVGTGRVALPLAARGVQVEGLDASPKMVARLRARLGGKRIRVEMGDFARFDTGGAYSLVFVVFNTFFALLTQDDQLSCFSSVARALRPGGRFLVEAFVPDLGRFHRGQYLGVVRAEVDHVMLDATRHDLAEQRIASQHILLSEDGVRLYPVQLRYAWPSELDLMARLAGLEKEARWGGWGREPFTSDSSSHVSVWRKPLEGPR